MNTTNTESATAKRYTEPAPDPHAATDLIARQLLKNTITARAILPHVNATLLRRMMLAALDNIDGKHTDKNDDAHGVR